MPAVPIERFDFIVNRRSGGVLKAGEEPAREEVLSRFGDKAGTFTYVDGSEIKLEVAAWAKEYAGQNRALVIGGGDGTLITAVEQVLGRDDITLGVLPLGTQNRFARRLGFSADFKIAARQYKSGQKVGMDVGKVNGMHFLVGIFLDKNSLRVHQIREDLRNKKPISALKNAFAAFAGLLIWPKKKIIVSRPEHGPEHEVYKGRVLAITNNEFKPRTVRNVPREGARSRTCYQI